ncbi:MAG: hypothetical protein JXR36_03780 [Bacteroidales bacterium]|nr:hypothetical protein [Bacteroidales bacterium]
MEKDKLKSELLKSYKSLNIGQVLMIIVWGVFAPQKTERYIERVRQGMNGKFAYREAKTVR